VKKEMLWGERLGEGLRRGKWCWRGHKRRLGPQIKKKKKKKKKKKSGGKSTSFLQSLERSSLLPNVSAMVFILGRGEGEEGKAMGKSGLGVCW